MKILQVAVLVVGCLTTTLCKKDSNKAYVCSESSMGLYMSVIYKLAIMFKECSTQTEQTSLDKTV